MTAATYEMINVYQQTIANHYRGPPLLSPAKANYHGRYQNGPYGQELVDYK